MSSQDSLSGVPSFLSRGSGFLVLCEQGDQGRLSGGGVEAGTLAGWLHGLLGARLELVCVLSLDPVLARDPDSSGLGLNVTHFQ